MEIAQLSSTFGSEIKGVDIPTENDAARIAAAREEFDDRQLILVRGQDLSLDDQVAFVNWFGEVRLPSREYSPESSFELYSSNAMGEKGTGQSLEFLPHQDYVWSKNPLPAICLYALEVTSTGGETIWTDLRQAYRTLDEDTKKRIGSLNAIHVGPPKRGSAGDTTIGEETDISTDYFSSPGALDVLEHRSRPLVSTHPRTGDKFLLVSRLQTYSVEGLRESESRALLDELLAHTDDPSLQYVHRWEVGDIIIWDNLSLCHSRTAFSDTEHRTLRKLQVDVHTRTPAGV